MLGTLPVCTSTELTSGPPVRYQPATFTPLTPFLSASAVHVEVVIADAVEGTLLPLADVHEAIGTVELEGVSVVAGIVSVTLRHVGCRLYSGQLARVLIRQVT